MDSIIIVESPSKSKTIEGYVGEGFKVMSSKGHIRDLATTGKDGLGIDIEHDFKPNYKIIKGKQSLINSLKKECKNKKVYLATDPDREGEAISYHLKEVLGLSENDYDRIVFHEITKPAVLDAFNHARKIDYDLVKSQETRRMLDRIIGFKVSKLLQNKIKSKSAGRVQSVALKLICDLEKDIESFVPEAYYELHALFDEFTLDLESYHGIKDTIKNKQIALDLLNTLDKEFTLDHIDQKEVKRESKPPYTTSTLQQDAANKLNYTSTRTMRIAQGLYEGKNIGNMTTGLITYMRTDSTRLADIFVVDAKKYIEKTYGKEYLGFGHQKAQKLAQDAHEAIRVTSIERTPESIKKYLTSDEYQLYRLIYNRTITSLMAPAKFMRKIAYFNNHDTIWKVSGQTPIFDGYLKVYTKNEEEDDTESKKLPDFKDTIPYVANEVKMDELYTKPKSRYTEATLIKDMEELGIGRPSTYAQTMSTLQERDYIKLDGKKLVPTDQGKLTNEKLAEFFSDIINVKYTANMENDLDAISKGEKDNVEELKSFYNEFEPLYEYAKTNMEGVKPELVDETCPLCGANLAKRKSKYGEFLACSNYPTCKYIKPTEKEENPLDNVDTGIICPKCNEGHIVQKVSKRGKNAGSIFYACSRFPKCNNLYSDEPTNERCPNCGAIMLKNKDGNLYCSAHCDNNENEYVCPSCHKGHLVKRIASKGKNKGNEFYACSNFPRCRFILDGKPTDEKCPICGEMMSMTDKGLVCANPNCKSKASN